VAHGTWARVQYLLLRHNKMPLASDASLAKLALSLLPYAVVLHTLFSAWSYSVPTVVASDDVAALGYARVCAVVVGGGGGGPGVP
jgi:hypothetical protein